MTAPKTGVCQEGDHRGMWPIHIAVLCNNFDAVHHLLSLAENEAEHVNLKQNEHFTPVLYACHKGNIEVLNYLMGKGGDIMLVSKKGVTALHLACGAGQLEMVEYLIDVHRLSPEIKTSSSGSLPMHVAAKGGHINVIQYLKEV